MELMLQRLASFFLCAVSATGDYAKRLGKALRSKAARRLVAAVMSLCLVANLLPMTAFSAESEVPPAVSGVCGHVHNEECGYIEAVEGVPCSHQNEHGSYSCAPILDSDDISDNDATPSDADYVCDHSDGCGYVEAVEGADCTHSCELCDPPEETLPEETPTVENPPKLEETTTDTCICDTLCTEDSINLDCPVCSAEVADLAECKGKQQEQQKCICETKCSLANEEQGVEESINLDCPVCSAENADLSLCVGETSAVFSALQRNGTTIQVDGTNSTLYAAISNANDGDTLQITADFKLTSNVMFADAKSLTLDLNGHTVTSEATSAITLSSNASLTVTDNSNGNNGTLKVNKANGTAIHNGSGGTVTVSGGKVLATTGTAINNGSTGEVTISGGEVSATSSGRAINNNSNGKVTISGGEVSATTGYAIHNNAGGTITVENGTVSAQSTTIYNNAAGTAAVIGGTVTSAGQYGYAIYNGSTGEVNVSGGMVSATGTMGIAINNGSTGEVTVSGGKVEVTSGRVINNVSTGKITISGTAEVTSGNPSVSNGAIYLYAVPTPAAHVLEITGGTVENTTTNGYAVYFNTNNTGVNTANLDSYYNHTGGTVGKVYPASAATVVEITRDNNTTKYTSLDAAITAANDGDTLKILDNINLGNGSGVTINGKSITLDLNGQTITYSGTYSITEGAESNGSAITLANSASLIVTDSSNEKNGKLEATGSSGTAIYNESSGKIIIESGTVSALGVAIHNKNNGAITITGGKLEATGSSGVAINNNSTGKITISGNAVVTSVAGAGRGTIYLDRVPTDSGSPVILYIQDTAQVTNTAANGYAVYFQTNGTGVTSANLNDYYSHTGGIVGKVYPEPFIVEITGDNNTTQYTSLSDAIGAAAQTGDTLKIIANINLGETGVKISGKTLTLDLNGNTITYSGTGEKSAITLLNDTGTELTVMDSSTGKHGKLQATGDSGRAILISSANATVKVEGGTVSATTGNAIFNNNTGTVIVSGGTVSATGTFGYAINNNSGGTINVSGGTVSAMTGRAIYNALTGTVTVSGGEVSATTGYAIYNGDQGGTVTISGGTVSATGASGKAIYNYGIGKITINGNAKVTSANTISDSGTIHLNAVPTGSGDLVVLDIQGGTVENTATPTAGYAVYFKTDGTGVTYDNLSSYYTQGTNATVGSIHPALAAIPTVEKLVGIGYTTYSVYANGAALIINGTSKTSTTVYVDVDRDGVIDEGVDKSLKSLNIANAPEDNADLTNCIIYGGSKGTSFTGNTKITMLGGEVYIIYGGGFDNGGDVIGSSEITLTGGYAFKICGGGNYANLTGSAKITVGTGGKAGSIYGVGEGGTVGTQGTTETAVMVLMEGESGTIYGGGDKGGVYGNTAVTVTGTVNGNVYGGGNDTRSESESTAVNGNTAIIVTGTVRDNVYGGGQNNSTVTGDQTLTLGGGAKIGSQSLGGVVINSADTTVSGAVKNGVANFKIDPNLSGDDGSVYVVLPSGYTGGTIATEAVQADLKKITLIGNGAAGKEAYLDGTDIKVRTTIVPTVSGQTIYAKGAEIKIVAGTGETDGIRHTNILYDADKNGTIEDTEYLKIGSTEPTGAGYDLHNYVIYGGGNGALAGNTKITMTGGNVNYIYGGNNSNNVTGNTEITMTDGNVNYIYGGNNSNNVTGNTKITMTGGNVNYIYGGNNSNDVNGNTEIVISGGEVKQFLYGGGLSGAVTGSTSVTIGKDATVSAVYGGNGSSGTVGTENSGNTVTVTVAGTAGSVCGGGSRGTVNGNISVTIQEGATVTGDVYGGGQAGSSAVNGDISVTVAGEVKSNVHGCGSGCTVNGKIDIKITGTVGYKVEGSYSSNSVTGKNTLTIGGGAKVGNGGLWSGVQLETLSDSRFAIQQTLGNDAYIYVYLPGGYDASANPVIATGAVTGDVAKIKLVGNGAAGKEAYFENDEIKVRASSAVVELLRGGTTQGKYNTLSAAITAAQGGDTLKILKKIDLGTNGVQISGKSLTLDLNGQTVTYSGSQTAITLGNDATLTVTDGGTGGKLEATGEEGYAILNSSKGTVTVTGGTVSASGSLGVAIADFSRGNIKISGDAVITSKNTSASEGTIYITGIPFSSDVALEITDGKVENTANGYAVYFSFSSVTSDNLSSYYRHTGGTVGKVHPEPLKGVELLRGGTTQGKYDTLADAINAAETGDTLKILNNITLSSGVQISGKSLILDLNGQTVTYSGVYNAITLGNNASLTVTDGGTGGKLEATGEAGVVIRNESAGTVTVTGGTVITVNENGAAIWNYSTGKVDVSGGTVSATGTSGPAIYNESTGKITISGDAVVTSRNTLPGTIYFQVVPQSNPKIVLEITGGTVENTAANGCAVYFQTLGTGVTSANVKDYYTVMGSATVGKVHPEPLKGVELLRGGTTQGKYDTLADAINAAETGDTLKILKKIELGTSGVQISGKSLTLDLNGQTVAYSGSGKAITLSNNASLTVTDGGTDGKLESGGTAIWNESTGTVTVKGGTVTAANGDGPAILNFDKGEIKIEGGTVTAVNGNGPAILNFDKGEIKVEGGTVSAVNGNSAAILNNYTGTVTVKGGTVSLVNGNSAAILNCSQGEIKVEGGRVSASGSYGKAILNINLGKITISGNAVVTSENIYAAQGTIYIDAVPNPAAVVLEISGGSVNNTETNGYAVYFNAASVNADNLGSYYSHTGGTVGKVYPEVSNTPTVASVIVSPNPATVQKGGTQQFTAIVSGTNNPAQTVSWSLSGAEKTGTSISTGGLLTVAADETAATLTVTATSTVDASKSGTATVTVQAGVLTDAQKLAMAKSAIEEALADLTVSNATTAQDILSVANAATLYNVTVAWDGTDGFSKTEATENANGFITGTLNLTLGSASGTVTVSKVIARLPADKSALTAAIAAANSAKNGVVVRDLPASSVANGTKFVTTAEMEALNNAITAAQTVMDNDSATDADITAAVSALNSAVAEFHDAIKTGTYTGGSSGSGSGSGGGGGLSSGSSGGSPTVTPSTGTKPGTPTESKIKAEGTMDKNGGITVNLSEKAVEDAIKAAEDEARTNGSLGNGIVLVINIINPEGAGRTADSVTVNLPKTTQETIIRKNIVNTVIVVDDPGIQIGIDLAAVTSINMQANADVNITATRLSAAGLTEAAKAAIGTRPVFDLRVNYGGGRQVTQFGNGSVSVAIPYALAAGESAGGVYAVYVDANGDVQWLGSSVYDGNTRVLRFSTNHFSTYGVGYKAPAGFTDIAGHWAKDDIQFVVNRGLLSGASATTFSPNTAMTRGMFVTALGRLAGADVSGYKQSSFTDVKADAYYMGYVEWAAKNGILQGTTAATFAPDNAVTREQMAVIMANYAKAIGFSLPKAHAQNTFADAANISPWAADSVKSMQMAGVLAGKNANRFDPQGTATRAEAAATLRRFVELMIDASTTQGWMYNDDGQWMYYENGSPVKNTTRNVDGEDYSFDACGVTLDFPKKKAGYGTYTVQAGDNFWKIARKHNVDMYTLAEINGKTIYSVIYPGDVLKIPE